MLTAPSPALEELDELLARRWLLLGVGNRLRADDGVGSWLARCVRRAGGPAVDGGAAPENVTAEVIRASPEVLLLADAVEMGERPGFVRLLASGKIARGGSGTHDASLELLIRYLRGRWEMDIHILAIQPGSRRLGGRMSAEVRRARSALVRTLSGLASPRVGVRRCARRGADAR